MTTVTVYRSTDASAPVLEGVVGSLTTLLDAVLINGYGSQSAAGWTTTFTGTNKRNYKNSPTDGTGCQLYIDDTGSGAGGAQEALMTGFQTTSALGVGTGQFPTSGQLNIGIGAVVCRKSATANSTARAWTIIADDTCFYLFTETGDYASPTMTSFFMFGDIFSYAASDPYKCMIMGRNTANIATFTAEWSTVGNGFVVGTTPAAQVGVLAAQLPGHFIAASQTGVGGSLIVGKHVDLAKQGYCGAATLNGTTLNTGANVAFPVGGTPTAADMMSYPNPVDNGLYLSPVWVHHNNSLRGYMKGLWVPCHYLPLNHDDTFTGTGAFSAKSFLAQYVMGNNASTVAPGEFIVETSSTWS